MAAPTFKTDKKMSFGTLLAYFGGGFVCLMIITFVAIKMFSGSSSNKKAVVKKSNVEMVEKPVIDTISNSKIAELTDTITKMDSNQREAATFIYSQNDRIKSLEGQVNSLLERIDSIEKNAQEEKYKQAVESSKKAATGVKNSNQNKITGRNGRHGVRVTAVVNKRAWLESEDGETSTVAPGDNISVRTVKVIDVNNADKSVITSTNNR